jgi:uncharacterized protein
MRFLCDAMLGGLAKWLRAAGYDTYYAREGTDISDRFLVQLAAEQDRALLTSDGGFLERKPVRDGHIAFLLVPHAEVEDQLRRVVRHYELSRRESRCMECNGELRTLAAGSVAGLVPPGVAERQEAFFRCVRCGRVFWYGSHWERIGGRLARVFG